MHLYQSDKFIFKKMKLDVKNIKSTNIICVYIYLISYIMFIGEKKHGHY